MCRQHSVQIGYKQVNYCIGHMSAKILYIAALKPWLLQGIATNTHMTWRARSPWAVPLTIDVHVHVCAIYNLLVSFHLLHCTIGISIPSPQTWRSLVWFDWLKPCLVVFLFFVVAFCLFFQLVDVYLRNLMDSPVTFTLAVHGQNKMYKLQVGTNLSAL